MKRNEILALRKITRGKIIAPTDNDRSLEATAKGVH